MSDLDRMIVNLELPMLISGWECKMSMVLLNCFFHNNIWDLHGFMEFSASPLNRVCRFYFSSINKVEKPHSEIYSRDFRQRYNFGLRSRGAQNKGSGGSSAIEMFSI